VEQLPELEPPEAEESETFRFVNGWLRLHKFLTGKKKVPGDRKDLPTNPAAERSVIRVRSRKTHSQRHKHRCWAGLSDRHCWSQRCWKVNAVRFRLACPWQFLIRSDRIKLLTGELKPMLGHVSANGRLRMCVGTVLLLHNEVNSPAAGTLPNIMWIT